MEHDGPKFLSSDDSDFSFDIDDPDDPILQNAIYDTQGDIIPEKVPDNQQAWYQEELVPPPTTTSYDTIPFNGINEARIIRDHIDNQNNCYVAIPLAFIGQIKQPSKTTISGYIFKSNY